MGLVFAAAYTAAGAKLYVLGLDNRPLAQARLNMDPGSTRMCDTYELSQADFLYLQRESGLTKGNLSSHLLKLEHAGYIEIQKTFRGKIPLTLLCLTRAGGAALEGYKKKMKNLLVPGQAGRR